MTIQSKHLIFFASVIGGIGAVSWIVYRRKKLLKEIKERETKLFERLDQQKCFGTPNSTTVVVSCIEDWNQIEARFLKTVDSTRMIGLDCEWLSDGPNTGKVALLQLALTDGLCVLVRTCKLGTFPDSLKHILSRYDVIKLGVAVWEDGQKFFKDFGIVVNGTVDLRFLVQRYCPGRTKKLGLKTLALAYLGVELDKDWRIRSQSWEDETLSPAHIEYASNDALVSVNVAIAVAVDQFVNVNASKRVDGDEFDVLIDFSRSLNLPFAGVKYNLKGPNNSVNTKKVNNRPKNHKQNDGGQSKLKPRNKHYVRKTPLYHNATLEAPDGELLCVCDIKKARWYVEKDLGILIQEEPLRVRLKFEPSGRPEGPAGEYYLTVKDNLCVVCGMNESYLRKYIVPHEYRKFFPEVMRDHQSHDVLLMCTNCHQMSNGHDMTLRRHLAVKCDAPIGSDDDVKFIEMYDKKAVRSAARAIMKDIGKNKIPDQRLFELKECIKSFYKVEEVDHELLTEAADVDTNMLNESYSPHGKKVVEFYIENEGLIPLERLWRQHFLDKMKPKFLPPLWSVDHQKLRLDIRASENRIDPNDYSIANEGQKKD